MNYIGIDLAWKISEQPRSRTGVAVIDDGGRLIDVGILATDDEILGFVAKYSGDACAVGIDAPLIIPNKTGQRPVERQLPSLGTSAYPANRSLFERVYNGVRGEIIVDKLNGMGFKLVTEYFKDDQHVVFEVFPSPFYRTILGLDSSIKIKKRRGVRVAGIRMGLGIAMDTLCRKPLNPPFTIDESAISILDAPIISQDVGKLRGIALDQFGDMLDAIVSAYMVYMYHRKPEHVDVIGDLRDGYILLPKPKQAKPYTVWV